MVMRWPVLWVIFSLLSFSVFAEEEEVPRVKKYVNLNDKAIVEFKVNLKNEHIAVFTMQAYVTTDAMETMLKQHKPMVQGVILEAFSMVSRKTLQSKKKRKKIIKSILKDVREKISAHDAPAPDADPAEHKPVDVSTLEELLLTSMVHM